MHIFPFLISVSVCLGSNGFVCNAASPKPLSSPVGIAAHGYEPLPMSSSNRRGASVATLTNLFSSVSFPAQVAILDYFNGITIYYEGLCCLSLLFSLITQLTWDPRRITTIPSYLSIKYFT